MPRLDARPEPLEVDFERSAIVVVDMQNAFASKGGTLDIAGSLRDAYFHDYWPILLTDGTMQAGERSAYEATVFNVESFFGWTMNSKQLCAAFAAKGR